jgi:hypothetical protein
MTRLIESRGHGYEMRLAVVDMMTPVMGGKALLSALPQASHSLRIMAVTGIETGEQRALVVKEILIKRCLWQRLVAAGRRPARRLTATSRLGGIQQP